MEKDITLVEALTGLDFVLTHLDGRKIRIANKPGEVIKHDQLMTVENLGMPFHKKTYQQGNLIIQFKVKFPNEIDAKSIALLHQALGGSTTTGAKGSAGKKEEVKDSDIAEVVSLKKFEEHHRNTHHRGGQGENESDEEQDEDGHGHGQRVGCQTQ